ncbi:MAG: hypothetical protein JRK53_16170 [Deltaproteobacteria bacterium]|nr:hypothetical protein [Deltaproteobacteria bacterium]MBW1819189.1 hypothetical protein [Deltaproteobacteria bacterium]
MKKASNPTWDHFRLLLFVLFLGELVLLFMAAIFGRIIGYDGTFAACFWIGVVVAGCFTVIVCLNLVEIGLCKIYRIITKSGL